MTRGELRNKIRAAIRVLALEVEARERKDFMLTPTGQLITDLCTLSNSQARTIATLQQQVATLSPSPEDLAAAQAAKDLLAAAAAAANAAANAGAAKTA